jgi:hypothetical protein
LADTANLPRRTLPYILTAWILLSTALGRSFTALFPSSTDSSLFAYFGYEWLHGRVIYIGLWDNKPPGIFLVDALTFRFFPKSFTALACVEGVFMLGCAATIYVLMRQWGAPKQLAWIATFAAAVACNLEFYNELGNLTNIYVLWPAVMSMYCFARAKPKFQGKWIFLAGVSSGVAALFNPVGLAPFLAQATFVVCLAVIGALCLRRAILSTAVNLAGIALPCAPVAAYFERHGALGEMLNASIFYNISYGLHSPGHVRGIPFHFALGLVPVASVAICSFVGLVLFALCRKWVPPNMVRGAMESLHVFWGLALLWLIYDSAGVMAGGRYYEHYFLCLLPSLCIVASCTCWFLISLLPASRQANLVANVLLILVAAPLLLPQLRDLNKIWAVVTHRGEALPDFQAAARIASVSRFIDSHRQSGATLFTWDYVPSIYLETGLPAASRYLDAHYMHDSPHAFSSIGNQILRDLRRTPPTFVVDATPDPQALAQRNPIYRQFLDFVGAQYKLEAELPGVDIWRPSFKIYERRAGP